MSEWDRFGAIETERLRLEPVTLADVERFVELDSDPEVMRYISGGKPSSREDVEAIVRANLGYRWVAYLRPGTEPPFVGWFAMKALGGKAYDLGYRLRREHWGQGLAREGARRLIDLAFHELGAERVRADTMTVNERSRRVMEACGLRYVRTYHLAWDEPIDGAELGDVEYELRHEDALE